MQTKIMTADRHQWKYFLALRDHKDADPNIQEVARLIAKILKDNPIDKARALSEGEWHLPYITDSERTNVPSELLPKISAARCARTSYKTHDNRTPTLMEDEALFNKLVGSKPSHDSPLDHQGRVPLRSHNKVTENFIMGRPELWERGVTHYNRQKQIGSGKMNNWICFRHWRK